MCLAHGLLTASDGASGLFVASGRAGDIPEA